MNFFADEYSQPNEFTDTEKLIENMSSVISIKNVFETGEVNFELVSPFLANLVINKINSDDKTYRQKVYAPSFYHEIIRTTDQWEQMSQATMRAHSYFDILYVLDGELHENIDEEENVYTAGTCRILTQNTHYTIKHTSDFTAIYIAITGEFIQRIRTFEDFYLFKNESSICAPLLSGFLGIDIDRQKLNVRDYIIFWPTIPLSSQTESVWDIFEKIVDVLIGETEYGSTFMLQALFCKFLGMLTDDSRYKMQHMHLERSKDAILFSEVSKLLFDSNGKITRTDLENRLNYNGSYIGRIVKKYSGMSLYDFSMTFCMAKAAGQIKNTTLPISEIIANLGFSNKTHFYRQFKKIYNMTPNDYRNLST